MTMADERFEKWATEFLAKRKQLRESKPRPTIAELERLLDEPNCEVDILPNGEVTARDGMVKMLAEFGEIAVQSHREAVGKRLRERAKELGEACRCACCKFRVADLRALADEFDPPVVTEEGKPLFEPDSPVSQEPRG